MNFGAFAEKLMSMDDDAWARHANPWSGWTRVATFPLLTAAIWSRDWVGWWALFLTALVLAWTWINPRLFSPPASTDNWMSRGVIGERMWLARNETPIPKHHEDMAALLNYASAAALLPFIWGLVTLEIWPTLFGMTSSMTAKLWFVDRMSQMVRDKEATAPQDIAVD